MNFKKYQEQVAKFLDPEITIEMMALWLVEQTGAIAGIRRKALQADGDAKRIKGWLLEYELGICLWSLAAMSHRTGESIDEDISIRFELTEEKALIQRLCLVCHGILAAYSTPRVRLLTQAFAIVVEIARCNDLDVDAIAAANLKALEEAQNEK